MAPTWAWWALSLAGAVFAVPFPFPQAGPPAGSPTPTPDTFTAPASTAMVTTNRFVSPIESTLAVPSSLASLLPSAEPGDGGSNLGMIVPLAVLIPIITLLVISVLWRRKAPGWKARWRESRNRREGIVRTGSREPEMAQVAAGSATSPGRSNGRGGAQNPNRSRRHASIRTVPEYSADANDTEIVLARAQRSPSIPSTVESSGATTMPYDPEGDEERHLTRQSSSALVNNSSREFVEVELAAAGTHQSEPDEATTTPEAEPTEPPPTYQDEPLGQRVSSVSMTEHHDLSIAPTATVSVTDLSSADDHEAEAHTRSSTFRDWFRLGGNASSSSLLPTANPRSSRPPSAYRTRHQRSETTSSSRLPFLSSSTNRPRAGSSASNLTISAPMPESFAQGAYGYPTASGFIPTDAQMRFLGSVEELNRVGAGPFGASRSSLNLARTRSRSVGEAERARPSVDVSSRGHGDEDAPPPPFVERERGSEGRERSGSRAPLRMPAYPREATSPPAATATAMEGSGSDGEATHMTPASNDTR